MNAMIRQKIRILYPRKNNLIVYEDGKMADAIRIAKDFRSKAKNVELLRKSKDKQFEEYIKYGKEYYAGSLIYLKRTGDITMINLVTGEQKEISNQSEAE